MGQTYITQAPSTWDNIKNTVAHPVNSLSAAYKKFSNDLADKAAFKTDPWSAIRNNFVLPAQAYEGPTNQDSNQSKAPYKYDGYQPVPQKPNDINAPAKSSGSGSSSNDAKIAGIIGRGWDDTGDVIKDTRKSLSTSKNYISNLGKVRDQYLNSIENYKNKTDQAIAGNKTLIEENQKKDLDTLAGQTRKSMDNTNVMLGVKGASGGSASRAAARAIAESAGKSRAGVLTNYGDETSKQNQAAKNAAEEYVTKREQAYEWEKTSRQQALDEYNAQKSALDRLNKKSSGWKDADLKAASDKNLNNLLGSLNAIQNQAKGFRDNIAAKMTEYGGLADALDMASVNVDAPAELDTPVFNENIDLTDPNNVEDFFDPNNTGKRIKVKSRDALGNPTAYEDAAGNEVDGNGDPITA